MTANTVTGAVAKRETGLDKVMWAKAKHLATILPDHVDVKSFIGTAWGALLANDDLMRCAAANPDSLMVALYRCAALGHQPGTDEFYLTPRGLKGGKGGPMVLGIEGYRGIVERMYRSGAVANVIVREVCANDPFRYVEGEMEVPVHQFGGEGPTGADFFGASGGRQRGQMVGVYAYARLTTGAVSRVVILTRDDVLAARDSGGYKADDPFTPWNRADGGKAHPEFQGRSMWWKTGAKRLEPWVPTSAEYRREQLRAAAAASDLAGTRPAPASGNGHAAAEEIHDAEIVGEPRDVPSAGDPSPPGPAEGTPERASSGQRSAIGKELDRLGIEDPEERLGVLCRLARRQIDAPADLTPGEAKDAFTRLKSCGDRAALLALVNAGDKPEAGNG